MRCEPVDTILARTPRQLACEGCGCTESRACPGGCHWASLDPPICSACEGTAEDIEAVADAGFFNQQRCPASLTPALHSPLWIDATSGYCARCHAGFVT